MATQPLDAAVLVQIPLGALRDAVDNAVSAATRVHKVRDTAEAINVYSLPEMTALGAYVHEQGGMPVAILVNAQASDPELTVLHEIGHYVDHHAIDAAGYASVSDDLNDWRDRVLNSDGVRDLMAAWLSPPVPQTAPDAGAVTAAVRAHVEYLLGPRELFARSYSQYVVVRSGDPKLRQELEKGLEPDYREQWHEDDFAPIADALDDLFDRLGWA